MRASRKESACDTYHVVSRGTGRQIIFEEDEDRKAFLRMLRAFTEGEAELYAWCLMENHTHLLLHAPFEEVPILMRKLNGTYARYFNAKAERTGHLFQERYLSEPVDDEAYLMTVIAYIHANPVKAGVAELEDFPWSSYREYVGEPDLCSTDYPLELFGGRSGFESFHHAYAGSDGCLDVDMRANRMHAAPIHRVFKVAEQVLGELPPNQLKALPAPQRNEKILLLRQAGLSIRQIERLTGIGRGTIARVT